MKIYFAGSIRGGRQDAEIYAKIVTHLKQKHEVLTEHVGDVNLSQSGEKNMTDAQIYERDCKWIEMCDCVVAEVTSPSLGVGYEIAYAEKLGKKVICLFNESKGNFLSAMLSGNKKIIIVKYSDLSVLERLDKII